MDSTICSANSLDSSCTREESNTKINLNNAILMSVEEENLSNANEIFYDVNEPLPLLVQPGVDVSIGTNRTEDKNFSHIFEHTNSTRLISLPTVKQHPDNRSDSILTSNSSSLSSLNHQQDTDTCKKNCKTKKRLPLKVILKRMFDEILGKHNKSTEESTGSNKILSNKLPLNPNTSFTPNLTDTRKQNHNDSLYQIHESNKSVTSIESLKDSVCNTSSSSQNTSSSLARSLYKKLTTILETSRENTNNTYEESFLDYSGKYIGQLPNLSSSKLYKKYCINDKVFNTSELNDTECTTSSNISANIEMLNEGIIRKANNLRDVDLKSINGLAGNKSYTYLEKSESYSSQNSSDSEESDDSSAYRSATESTPIKVQEKNNNNFKLSNFIKPPTPQKISKKRRSLSAGADIEVENNKTPNHSKSPKRGRFYNRTNSTAEWGSYSPTNHSKSTSPFIITSPIKSVQYLRNFFTKIGHKNKKQSPMTHESRKTRAPFIIITPATPSW